MAGVCTGNGPCDVSPTGHGGDNFVTRGGGLPPYVRAIVHSLKRHGHTESQAVELAIGTIKRWARGEGNVSAATRARAAKALAEWEALKAKAHATPNSRGDRPGHEFHGNQWTHMLGAVFDGQHDHMDAIRAVKQTGHARIIGAGPRERVLAETIRKRVAAEGVNAAVHPVVVDGHHFTRVFDTARHSYTRDTFVSEAGSASVLVPKANASLAAIQRHVYRAAASDRKACADCGQPIMAPPHQLVTRPRRKRVRHAGKPGHAKVTTGHHTAARRRTLAQIHGQADNLEPAITTAMRGLFAAQRKATLDRLKGRRGQQMIRAAQQPPTEPPPPGEQPAPLVDAAQIYDLSHWIAKTQESLAPAFAAVKSMTADRFAGQLGAHETKSSLAGVQAALDTRLQRLAQTVSATTFDQVAQVLRDGVAQGQTVAQMTTALEKVFTDAEANRAPTIARTESLGALNEAAAVYAQNVGADVVAGKEWLSAHDDRVRPTHRVADGQVRSVAMPFDVGGVPMLFPHDPAAPPDETVNCRCSTAYLTPAEYAKRTQPADVAA